MTDKNTLQELKPNPGYPEFDFTRKDFKGFDNQATTPQANANSATPTKTEHNEQPKSKNTSAGMYAGIGIVAVVVIALAIYIGGISSLKHNLTSETWSRYDDGITLYLDFSDDEINYSMYGSYVGRMTISDMDYKITGPNTIKVKYGYDTWRTIHVKVDSSGILECKPALTSTDSYEFWY